MRLLGILFVIAGVVGLAHGLARVAGVGPEGPRRRKGAAVLGSLLAVGGCAAIGAGLWWALR